MQSLLLLIITILISKNIGSFWLCLCLVWIESNSTYFHTWLLKKSTLYLWEMFIWWHVVVDYLTLLLYSIPQYVYPFYCWALGSLQFGALRKITASNMLTQNFKWTYVHFYWVYSKPEWNFCAINYTNVQL